MITPLGADGGSGTSAIGASYGYTNLNTSAFGMCLNIWLMSVST
jgi:hypothetical protein